METKAIVMLIVLILVALIGCGGLVYTMMNLDKNDENHKDDHHGH